MALLLMGKRAGSIDAPRWPPTLPYPAIDQGKLPIFLPPPSHHQPVLQKDIPRTPPPSGGDSDPLILHPREINTIPRPRRISQKNLRAEMRLDATSDAKAYYSKIRVSMQMAVFIFYITCLNPRASFVDSCLTTSGWTGLS